MPILLILLILLILFDTARGQLVSKIPYLLTVREIARGHRAKRCPKVESKYHNQLALPCAIMG